MIHVMQYTILTQSSYLPNNFLTISRMLNHQGMDMSHTSLNIYK